jgi:hypothetical protein
MQTGIVFVLDSLDEERVEGEAKISSNSANSREHGVPLLLLCGKFTGSREPSEIERALALSEIISNSLYHQIHLCHHRYGKTKNIFYMEALCAFTSEVNFLNR